MVGNCALWNNIRIEYKYVVIYVRWRQSETPISAEISFFSTDIENELMNFGRSHFWGQNCYFYERGQKFQILSLNSYLLAKYLLHTIKINGTYLQMRTIFGGTSQFILSLTLVPLHFHHSILCVPSLCTPGAAVWVGPWGLGNRSFPHLNLKMDRKNSLDNNCIKS